MFNNLYNFFKGTFLVCSKEVKREYLFFIIYNTLFKI